MCAWFQDFLRSIPGSLLCCELHGEWVDVLEEEEEEEEEQVQDIKRCTCTHSTLLTYLFQYHLLRFLMQILTNGLNDLILFPFPCLLSCRMICRLPKENALLLRYLLAMLHGIQGNAQENQMTSFNLSVCIAPSMLWPPGAPCSPEAEGEGTKKVREGSWTLSNFDRWSIKTLLTEKSSFSFAELKLSFNGFQ